MRALIQWRDASLHRKLTLVIIATTIVALLLSSVAIVGYQLLTYRDLMVNELGTLAEILGQNGSAALVFRIPEDAQDLLASVKLKPHVISASFFTPDGALFAEYSRTEEAIESFEEIPLEEGYRFTPSRLILMRDIPFNGEWIGIVRIIADLEPVYRQVLRSIGAAALVFVISLGLAVLLSNRLLRVVSQPITSLVETTHEIARSGDYSLRAEKYADDELGRLTTSFNQMLGEIQTSTAEVRRAHNELRERLVELDREKEQLKKAQKREIDLQEKLSRSERMESLAVLAGGVAHDLNNILGPMVAYPDLMLSQLPEDHELYRNISRIGDSARKAAGVIQDFLTLGRRGSYETENVQLNQLISSYLDSPSFMELQERFPEVHVEQDLDPDLWPILGSLPHLTQVVMNLTINAFEAMNEGGILRLKTEGAHLARPISGYDSIPPGQYSVLRILDTGVGIDPQDIGHIFEPFYTRKKLGRSGSGLGLAVVYGVVKDLKGFIDVRSTWGDGTEFWVYFPAQLETLPAPEADIGDYRGYERILVVDDVEEQRDLAAQVLESYGYRTEVAENGRHAVEMLRHQDFDLIVLDMIMEEDFDGLETYRQIIARKPSQKCVLASGFSESDRVKEAQALGAGQYVSKPYTRRFLARAVREELDRSLRRLES